jgi:hypothetical protein
MGELAVKIEDQVKPKLVDITLLAPKVAITITLKSVEQSL